ncbi:potassium channel family protein [Gayadomonas joobiniege]|uniref:potassium channel family protein n=1 Tax=Gayadomonas joobiniege TaxID=1234606 RepID=UPI0003805BC4|nr:potassium channel family protein [Gayadomonas joobiniege]
MILKKLISTIQKHVHEFSWLLLIVLLVSHILLTWIGLRLSGEHQLTGLSEFPYYYVVTTSTVGYGDLSPTTEIGRIWVWLFQIPVGLALFGAFLGKMGQDLTFFFRRKIMGNGNLNHYKDHILLFGYHDTISKNIIKHILADLNRQNRKIVLCDQRVAEHPLQAFLEHVDFIKLNSYTDETELSRTGIRKAARVIILGRTDDETLTTALKISVLADPSCHITAWLYDPTKVELLRAHCANIECSSSRIAESLVRSMQDPGASRVQEQLLSSMTGDTQYALQIPTQLGRQFKYQDLFTGFKDYYDATLLGVAKDVNGNKLELNPRLDTLVNSGDYLHYIGNYRLKNEVIDWQKF